MDLKKFSLITAIVAGTFPSISFAEAASLATESDDLGAAEPLDSGAVAKTTAAPEPNFDPFLTYRGYVDLEYINNHLRDHSHAEQWANWEGALKLQTPAKYLIQGYGDFSGYYFEDGSPIPEGLVNEWGLRLRPHEKLAISIGKERNRRAPGLLYSPSDLLHSTQAAPGLREERTGVWLGRVSYQTESATADLIYLPVDKEHSNGMPKKMMKPTSGIIRTYNRLLGVEVSVSAGRIRDINRYGAYLQGFAFDVFKLYGEWGYEQKKKVFLWEREHVVSWLMGTSFEGLVNATITFEYLKFPANLTDLELKQLHQSPLTVVAMFPFVRRHYVIGSIGYRELWDRINVFVTGAKSLEDKGYVGISRLEGLLSDQFTCGASYLAFGQQGHDSPELRPLNERISFDLKWSF